MKTATILNLDCPPIRMTFPSSEPPSPPLSEQKPGTIRRGPWSPEEDRRLMEIILLYGPSNWVRISVLLVSRLPKQCRERYHQNLKPLLNRNPINSEEGLLIEKLVLQHGKKWAEIARHLPGRSDNAIKNWWNGGANRRRRALHILYVDPQLRRNLGADTAEKPSGLHPDSAPLNRSYSSTLVLSSQILPSPSALASGGPLIPSLLANSQNWRRRLTGFLTQSIPRAAGKPEVMHLANIPVVPETRQEGPPGVAFIGKNNNIAFNTMMFGGNVNPVHNAGNGYAENTGGTGPAGAQLVCGPNPPNAPLLKVDAGLADSRVNYRYMSVPLHLAAVPTVLGGMLASPVEQQPVQGHPPLVSFPSSGSLIPSISSTINSYNPSRNGSITYEYGPYPSLISPFSIIGPNLAISSALSGQNLRRPLALPPVFNSVPSHAAYVSQPSSSELGKLQHPLRDSENALNLVAVKTEIPSTHVPKTVHIEAADDTDEGSSENEEKKMCVSNLIN